MADTHESEIISDIPNPPSQNSDIQESPSPKSEGGKRVGEGREEGKGETPNSTQLQESEIN